MVVVCACALQNYSALKVRLSYVVPGCTWFLGSLEHTGFCHSPVDICVSASVGVNGNEQR